MADDAHIDPWIVRRWCIFLFFFFLCKFLVSQGHGPEAVLFVVVKEFVATKIVVIDFVGVDWDGVGGHER